MPQTPSAFSAGATSGASKKPLGFQTSKRLLDSLEHEFHLIMNFANGYRAREDISILLPGTMVEGSQNVLTNTFRRLQSRQGYTLYGEPDTSGAPILSWFDYAPVADNGPEIHGRAGFLTTPNTGKLQFLFNAQTGDYYNGTTYTTETPVWVDLLTGLSSVNFNTAQWSPTITPGYVGEIASDILMVNGTNNLYIWTGANTTIASANNASGKIATAIPSSLNQGQNYVIGDTFTISGGGNNATATVTSLVSGLLGAVTLAQAGTGYVVGDIVTPAQTNGVGASMEVGSVDVVGGVVSLSVVSQGTGYATQNFVPTSGGTGGHGTAASILEVDITSISNNAVNSFNITEAGSGYSVTGTAATVGGTGTGLEVNIQVVQTGEIVLNGLSAAQQNFATQAGNPKYVVINGNSYQYLYAIGNSLVGITPSPAAEPAQSIIWQKPINQYAANINGYTLDTIDLISSLASQVYYGTLTDTNIFMSKVQDFLDCTSTTIANFTGSTQGDGAQILLDVPPTSFLPQVSNQNINTMSVFAGEDYLYNVDTTFGSTTVGTGTNQQSIPTQNVVAVSQKLTRKQAAQSQKFVTKNKNDIIYLSFSPSLNSFGLVDNLFQTQQVTNLSYPIINDMNMYDFTDGSVTYDKDFIYMTVPKEGLLRIYNQTDQTSYIGDTPSMQETKRNFYWECPQTIPITGVVTINSELYGHSYQSSETYKLFSGYRDRAISIGVGGAPILARATFCYNNYSSRFVPKLFKGYYLEGNISTNTTLNIGVYYDYSKNTSPTQTLQFLGTSINVLPAAPDNSLGMVPLGINPLGTTLATSDPNGTPNPFRVIKDYTIQPFFQEQTSIYSNQLDGQWQIVAYGTNATTAPEGNNFIHEA